MINKRQFHISDNTMVLAKPTDTESSIGAITPPYYEKRTIDDNRLLQTFNIYSVDGLRSRDNDDILYSWSAINPDGSKIVQATKFLSQITIIDTQSGEIDNYRMKDSNGLSFLESNSKSANIYYHCVHADNNYIYASYWGRESWYDSAEKESPLFNTIHIFNWDGKLLYELTTDKYYFRIWKDQINNRLYTIDKDTDEIYYLNLDDILE